MGAPDNATAPVYETDEPVLYRVDGATAWITLNRPSFANAQNGQMTYALDDAFRRAVDDDGVRVIVLGGAGKHFCAGHDIGTPGRDAEVSQDRRHLWYDHVGKPGAEWAYAREQELYLGMCRRWREMPKPTIAMVQGACIAGGLALAWVCDLIIASEDAFFQDPVLRMGIPGIEYFAHAFEMPPRLAKEFLFMGEKLPARRAHEMGMINRVVPRDALAAEAASVAARVAANPRMALALAKQAVNHVEDLRGLRTAMDAVFHMHHLAHAQNNLLTGDRIGGVTHRDIARGNEQAASSGTQGE